MAPNPGLPPPWVLGEPTEGEEVDIPQSLLEGFAVDSLDDGFEIRTARQVYKLKPKESSADVWIEAITEVMFIHMRAQMKGVLQLQRDEWTKEGKRDLERMRRANGLIYPLEHSVRRRLRMHTDTYRPLAFASHCLAFASRRAELWSRGIEYSRHRRCSGGIVGCPVARTTTSMVSSTVTVPGARAGRATSSPG